MTHVLIVDDDDAIRESLHVALEDAGHTVSEAGDGLAALRALREGTERTVVLLDLMMPGLDGAGVLGEVAASAELASHNAFIVMTADTRTFPLAFANLLLSLKIPYISKPFDVDRLLGLVDDAAQRLQA